MDDPSRLHRGESAPVRRGKVEPPRERLTGGGRAGRRCGERRRRPRWQWAPAARGRQARRGRSARRPRRGQALELARRARRGSRRSHPYRAAAQEGREPDRTDDNYNPQGERAGGDDNYEQDNEPNQGVNEALLSRRSFVPPRPRAEVASRPCLSPAIPPSPAGLSSSAAAKWSPS